MKDFFSLLRPTHWLKNLLVFVALFFSFQFSQHNILVILAIFIAFCLLSSGIYIYNDILDRELDRAHPVKRNRPVASGAISLRVAYTASILLIIACLIVGSLLSWQVFIVFGLYTVLNIAYSVKAKHLPIIDVMILAIGFVLRVIAGAVAIGVLVSQWLLLCTFFVSLFLAFGKRKHEIMEIAANKITVHRRSLSDYAEGFLDQMLSLAATATLVCYAIYSIDSRTATIVGSDAMVLTVPIAAFGLFYYLHLLYNKKGGGDPVRYFYKDPIIIGTVLIYLLTVAAIRIYHPQISY